MIIYQGPMRRIWYGKRWEHFLEFSTKMKGFIHFIAKNVLWVVRNWDRRGLIDPSGVEDVKRTGG